MGRFDDIFAGLDASGGGASSGGRFDDIFGEIPEPEGPSTWDRAKQVGSGVLNVLGAPARGLSMLADVATSGGLEASSLALDAPPDEGNLLSDIVAPTTRYTPSGTQIADVVLPEREGQGYGRAIGREVVKFAGDLATDPLTPLSFGSGTIGKVAGAGFTALMGYGAVESGKNAYNTYLAQGFSPEVAAELTRGILEGTAAGLGAKHLLSGRPGQRPGVRDEVPGRAPAPEQPVTVSAEQAPPIDVLAEREFLTPDLRAAVDAEQARLAREYLSGKNTLPGLQDAITTPAAPRLGATLPPFEGRVGSEDVRFSPRAAEVAAEQGVRVEPTQARPDIAQRDSVEVGKLARKITSLPPEELQRRQQFYQKVGFKGSLDAIREEISRRQQEAGPRTPEGQPAPVVTSTWEQLSQQEQSDVAWTMGTGFSKGSVNAMTVEDARAMIPRRAPRQPEPPQADVAAPVEPPQPVTPSAAGVIQPIEERRRDVVTDRREQDVPVYAERRVEERRARIMEEDPTVSETHAERIARAEQDARTDPLTGMENSRAFQEALQTHQGPVVSLDLAGLGYVNDNMGGHPVGDAFLKAAADALREEPGVRVFRAGEKADEFALLADDPAVAQAAATSVQQRFERAQFTGLKNGEPVRYTGGRIDYGVGTEGSTGAERYRHGDVELFNTRERAVEQGFRSGVKGSRPPGLREVAGPRDLENPPPAPEGPLDQPSSPPKYSVRPSPVVPKRINPDSLSREVLDRMSRNLKARGFDVRGSDDVRAIMKRTMVKDGQLWDADWKAAYEAATAGAKARVEKGAQKKTETPHVNWEAVRKLGTTTDPQSAGYVRPDGRLMDLSGGSGSRAEDHRIVGGTAGMQELQNAGYVRWMPEGGGFDITVKPSDAQLRTLRSLAERRNGEIILDLEDGLGEFDARNGYYRESARKTSLEYPQGTKTERIIGDIRRFYAGEDLPTGMRYSTEKKPAFFSALSRAVDETKQPAQSGDQWARYLLSRPGVKAEEARWSGLDDFLKERSGKRVSKEEVQTFLRENRVDVKEVMKGRGPEDQREEYVVRDDAGRTQFAGTLDEANRMIRGRPGWGMTLREVPDRLPSKRETKFGQYTIPGGENYRELLLTLPSKTTKAPPLPPFEQWLEEQPWRRGGADVSPRRAAELYTEAGERQNQTLINSRFKSGHYDEPNILAHVRFNERTDAQGKRVLFIEEVQSDWAQKGRREGFEGGAGTRRATVAERPDGTFNVARDGQVPEGQAPFRMREEAEGVAERMNRTGPSSDKRVPAAPFVGSTEGWTGLAMKHVLRHAAENGFDRVAWTTGEQQAARYDLSKQVHEVRAFKRADGTHDLMVRTKDTNQLHDFNKLSDHQLTETVGKDLADKIIGGEGHVEGDGRTSASGGPWRSFSGLDLKVGGEGMKGYYDQILPAWANKYGKKWGARVGETKIKARAEGVREFAVNGAGLDTDGTQLAGVFPFERQADGSMDLGDPVAVFRDWDAAIADAKAREPGAGFDTPVHSLDVTPEMRSSVMEGQPLFKAGERGAPASDGGRTLPEGYRVQPGKTPGYFDVLDQDGKKITSGTSAEQATARAIDRIRPHGIDTATVQRAFPTAKVKPSHIEGGWEVHLPGGRRITVAVQPDGIAVQGSAIDYAHPESRGSEYAIGEWRKIDRGGIIKLSKTSPDLEATLGHETFHAAMDMALTPKEQAAVLRHYSKAAMERYVESGERTPWADLTEQRRRTLAEEVAADAYATWNPREKTHSMFGKILAFFRNVYRAFKPTWESAFEATRSGKAFERGAGGARSGGVDSFAVSPKRGPGGQEPTSRKPSTPEGGIRETDLPETPAGYVRLFKANKEASRGLSWAESLDGAKAYADNPGFGGENLFFADVKPEYVLDVRLRAGKNPWRSLADAVVEDDAYRGVDPHDLAVDWQGSYDHPYQVLENSPKAAKALSRLYDWIKYTDDFPEGATTWRALSKKSVAGPVRRIITDPNATAPPTRGADQKYATAPKNPPEPRPIRPISPEKEAAIAKKQKPLGRPMLPGEAPRVEHKVAALEAVSPDADLSRNAPRTWESLDPEIRTKLAEIAEKPAREIGLYERARTGRLNDVDVQTLDALVAGKRESYDGIRQRLLKAQEEGRDTGPENVSYLRAALDRATAELALAARSDVEAGTKLGRALAARARVMDAAGKSMPDQLLRKLFREIPDLTDQQAGNLLRIYQERPQDISDALIAAMKPARFDQFLEMWKAGLVSGIPTQGGNILGNIGEQIVRLGETATAAAIDPLLGGPKTRLSGEARFEFGGAMKGVSKSLGRLGTDLRDIVRLAPEEFKLDGDNLDRLPKISGKTGRAIRIPFRFLSAFDDFFKGMGGEAELHKLAYREAKGDLSAARRLIENPTDDMLAQVAKSRLERTFQDPNKMANAIITFRANQKWAHIVAPFVQTPSNIARVAWQRSPGGFYEGYKALSAYRTAVANKAEPATIAKLKGEAVDRLARPLFGTALMASFYAVAKGGGMTGSGPTDPKDRNALRDSGWQPYSFVVGVEGGKRLYIPFQRIEPVSSLLGIAADAAEAADSKIAGDLFDKGLGSIIQNFTSKTYLQGIADAAEAVSDPKRFASQYVSNLAGSIVPTIVAKGAQAIDPTIRDTRASSADVHGIPERIAKTIMSRIPGASMSLPARKGGTGEDATRPGSAFSRFASPILISEDKPNAEVQRALVELDAVPTTPRRELGIPNSNGRKVRLMDDEYQKLTNAAKAATAELRPLLASRRFLRLEAEDQRAYVRRIYDRHQTQARKLLLRDQRVRDRARAIMREARP